MSSDKKKKTLSDAEIGTERPEGRRRFMGLVAAGGVAAGAGVVGVTAGSAVAQTGYTDSDNGSCTDAVGYGRGSGGYNTGITDADNGSAGTDLGGQGRGGC